MKVYVLAWCDYDEYRIYGIFANEKDARATRDAFNALRVRQPDHNDATWFTREGTIGGQSLKHCWFKGDGKHPEIPPHGDLFVSEYEVSETPLPVFEEDEENSL